MKDKKTSEKAHIPVDDAAWGSADTLESEWWETRARELNAMEERNELEDENYMLRVALRQIRDGEFDDLKPDSGLHETSARQLARQTLAKLGKQQQ